MKDPVTHSLELFRNGLFCSEAIVQAFNEDLQLGLDGKALRIATVFGAGFGGAKCSCGSLTGALVVLGAVGGRTTAEESVDLIFSQAADLHDAFRKKFGQVCCRWLTREQEWGAPEHHAYCERFVEGAAELLHGILKERDEQQTTKRGGEDHEDR